MNKTINAEAFEAFVQKSLKMSAEDLASLYNEAGELNDFSLLAQKDAERISKLTSDKTNQYNRGLKEGALKLEKELKEKYDIESDLIGVELFDQIITTKLEEVKGAKPEEVLKHPDVIKALNEKDKLLKQKDKEMKDAIAAKENEINAANLFKEIEGTAFSEFENLNPILPSDAKKVQALKGVFSQDLKKFKYQKNESGEIIVIKEDGSPLKDDHGYDVTFADHVKGIADRYFDFKAAEDRSSAGNKDTDKPKPSSKKVRMPKDEADYIEMMKDQSLTPQERVEIKDLFRTKK